MWRLDFEIEIIIFQLVSRISFPSRTSVCWYDEDVSLRNNFFSKVILQVLLEVKQQCKFGMAYENMAFSKWWLLSKKKIKK